ncbi:MAG: polysaccharide biosynthesis/export family protein [Limnohabitans sp.]
MKSANCSFSPRCVFLPLSLAAAVFLAGCAAAPGMRYEEPVADANQPATAARLVPITPNVIAGLKNQGDAEFKALASIMGAPQPYTMGPGDVLSLTIWDSPQVPLGSTTLGPVVTQGTSNETSTVPAGLSIAADGTVRVPYIGSVKLVGMTEAQATEVVTKRLAKYIRDPQITLRVSAYRSKKVFIDGEVRTPGQVVITDVPMTIAEAIARSGGISGSGDSSNVTLFRAGKQYRINLPLLAKKGVAPSGIPLQSGDLLRVAAREEGRVSVMGEVSRPSTLNMRNGALTLQDALAEVGGVNTISSNPNQIYVIRNTGANSVPEVYQLSARSPVMLALAENFDLRPKDIVFVDPAPLALWNRVISLILPSAGLTRQTIDLRDVTK